MATAQTDLRSLPHAVFLHRAAGEPDKAGLDSKLGQGAFLALRLIDLLAPGHPVVPADAFQYQWAATDRFCRGLRQASTEGAHLNELVASAAAAYRQRDIRLLTPEFFAYAHFLEDSLHLEESLDVLATLGRIAVGSLAGADSVALSLRVGRVNRKLNRFDAAEAAYTDACERAATGGDRRSELLGRIGYANSLLGRGNLPGAERRLGEVLTDARQAGETDAEARAEHGLAVVLQHRGSPDSALKHMWRAFELYEDEESRLRALGDVGIMMLTLGDPIGAERALKEVVRCGGMREKVVNATIELMHCASFRRDRVSFERYRAKCEQAKTDLPPNILADYYLKAGIGEARFGRFRSAAATMTRALKVAEDAGLHSFVFKIERIRNGLGACEEALEASSAESSPVIDNEALREVSACLAQLVGGGQPA
jgi:tetratricopeptide (TPR) repeat protein